MSRAGLTMAVIAVICPLTAAACGGGKTRMTAVRRQCQATVGFEGPTREPLGKEQLAFARLAVANDDASQRTRISLVVTDSGPDPTLAADRFAVGSVVAVVGPDSDSQVRAQGSVFARAGLAFVSGSATGASLTNGANPTFFRVVPSDSLQAPFETRFVLTRLRPRAVTVVDDGSAATRPLVRAMAASLRAAKIPMFHISAIEGVTPIESVAARISPLSSVAVLAWHVPREADQLGRILLTQRKTVTLVGPSQLFAPGVFATPGSYVTYPAPDITALPADAAIVQRAQSSMGSFEVAAPPAYVAAHVIDSAISAVCRSGRIPSRSGVLAAIRSTDQPSSLLGVPIRFRPNGELTDGEWFIFRIEAGGRYRMLPTP
jgi:branched-chain amino acid transport system substrate-binding protein